MKANRARAVQATRVEEVFDLRGATAQGGAGPFIDYALNDRRLGGRASVLFDALKAANAYFTGGFEAVFLVLMRALGFIRPQEFAAVSGDPYLAVKLGAERLPDATTVHRALHRFGAEEARDGLRTLHRETLEEALHLDGYERYVILDVDSTVEVCYGEQVEGAAVGYNPRARGRRSYRPLLFTDGVRDLVVGAWLRPGDASDKTDLLAHYRETRDWLASINRPIRYARFDRGFCGEDLYSQLEEDGVGYTVKARLTRGIRSALGDAVFRRITDEDDPVCIEVADVVVRLHGWSRPRRVVVVRRESRREKQRSLAGVNWRHEAIVTNLDWAPEEVWRFYNGRCQAENLIKELKQDYGIDQISTGDFGANDADLVIKVIAFNLVWAFRRQVLPSEWHSFTTGTLRNLLFRIPGVLVRHARRWLIHLAQWARHRALFPVMRRRLAALAT